GRIGDSSHTPFASPASDRHVKKITSKREPDENKNSQIGQELRAMVKHVMPHLVGHNLANLQERTLLEQVVIERNPRRAKKSRDIRAYSRGLTRRVHFKDLFHWNLIGPRHCQNRISDLRIS